MGVFLTGGYIFQTLGSSRRPPSNAGFITGLFVVLTPGARRASSCGSGIPPVAWAAAGVARSACGCSSGPGTDFNARGDGLVLVCAFSLAAHILATSGAVKRYDVGALLAIQLGVVGLVTARRSARWPATSRRRRARRSGRR